MKSKTLVILCGMFMVLMVYSLSGKAEETAVTVGFGTLKIGGIYQATFNWYEDDNTASQFKMKRARTILSGTLIPDKVKFFVQADAVASPYLLDSKLMLLYIPKTELSIGRMLPNFSLYMPYSTAKLDFINYPLTTTKYAMWRQTGIQSITSLKFVDISLGVFNGYVTDSGSTALKGDDWGDRNDAKDFLFRADLKPVKGLKVGLFGWLGKPFDVDAAEDFTANRFGANVEWYWTELHVASEWISSSTEYTDSSEVDSVAYMGQVSYALSEQWEVLGRYDFYDGNTDLDDNAENWITGGVNFSLAKINTKFYLNYIMKGEEGDEIDNDELVIQAQYSF